MADLTGRKLGKYELVERLGRGGMAEVYKAYQPGMDRFVAVKVMHSHLAETGDFVTRFRREAQLVGQLRHPHIVQVIDFDVSEDVYYMVMEYIQGETLKFYIQQKGPLPPEEALRITSKLADALSYAHSKGMIHRDIKPSNVMFTDRSFAHPVLTDFGIARIISGETQLTASGAFVGTPAYISPETARGEAVDARADIYSMGIMLYEMLTGKVPYDADTPFAVIMKHVNDPLPSPRQFNIDVTESIELVLLTALAKDRNDRYQAAGALKVAVDKALESLATERPTRSAQSGGTTAISSDGTITGNVSQSQIGTAALGPDEVPTEMGSLADIQARPTRNRLPLIAGVLVILAVIIGGAIFALSGGDDNGDDSSGQPAAVIDDSGRTQELEELITEADSLVASGDYEAAIEQYDQALQQAPEDPELYTKRGDAYARSNDIDAAFADYENALIFDEDFVPAYVSRGKLYIQQDSFANAINDLSQAVTRDETNLEANIGRAEAYTAIGELDLALTDLNQAIAIDPDSAEAHVLRGEVYRQNDNEAAALTDFSRAVELDPTNAQAFLGRANILSDNEDYQAAITDLDLALAADPNLTEGYTLRGFAYLGLDNPQAALDDFQLAIEQDEAQEEAVYGRGIALYELGNYQAAIEDLTAAIEAEPTADRYILRGEAYNALGTEASYHAARDDFVAALSLEPDRAYAHYALGLALEQIAPPQEAIDQYTEAINLEPEDPNAYIERAWLYVEVGDTDAARQDFEYVLNLDAQNPSAQVGLGDLALEAGDYEQAIDWNNRVLEQETNQYAYFNRGLAYQALEQYDNALEDFNAAIEHEYDPIVEAYVQRAFTYQALGDDIEAIVDFTNALAEDDSWGVPYLGRGVSHVNQENYEAALTDLDSALAREVDDLETLYEFRGEAYLGLGEYAAALADYEAAFAASDGDNIDLYFGRGTANLYLENYDAAIDDFTRLVEANYDALAEVYVLRGRAFSARDDLDRALQDFNEAIELDGELADAYLQRGLVYRLQGSYDRAEADFNQALNLDDTLAAAYYYRADIFSTNGDLERAIADYDLAIEYEFDPIQWAYLDRGVTYAQLGDLENAVRSYSRALEIQPDYGIAYYNRGLSYYRLEDYERAIENYTLAIENNYSDLAGTYLNRGLSYDLLGDQEAALADYNQAIELNPQYALAYYNRGSTQQDLGNNEAAIEDYTQAIDLGYEPLQAAYLNRGLAYDDLSRDDEAIADYNQALRIDPDYSLAYNNRGFTYLDVANYEGAIEDFERALELGYEPSHWPLYGIGEAAFNMQQYDVALDNLNLALERLPGFTEALTLRSQVYLALDDRDAALADLTSLIQAGSDSPDAYYQRGEFYAQDGNYQAAIQDFDRAILLRVDFVDAYFQRALAYIELNDNAAAERDLTRVLTFDDQFAPAYEVLGDILHAQERYEEALTAYRGYVDIMGSRSGLHVLNRIAQIQNILDEQDAGDDGGPDDQSDTPPATDAEPFEFVGSTVVVASDSLAVIARFDEINRILANEGPEAALDLANAAVEANSNSAALLALRGEIYSRLDNPAAALADIEAAIAADPNHPAGHLVRSAYYVFNEYNEAEAIASGQRAVELAPQNGRVALVFAHILRNLGHYGEAFDQLNRAEQLGAPIGNVLTLATDMHEETHNYEALATDLNALLSFGEDDPFLSLRLAAAYIVIDDKPAALEVVRTRIDNGVGDDFPEYYAQSAYVAYRAGEFDLASEWARTALALQDNIPAADYVLALLDMEAGQYDDAIARLEGLGDVPTWEYDYPFLNPYVGGHLPVVDIARAQAAAGDVQEALRTLSISVENEPFNEFLRLVRARVFLQSDAPLRAARDILFVLRHGSDPFFLNNVADSLVELGPDALFGITFSLLDTDDPGSARLLLERATNIQPADPRLAWLEGRFFLVGVRMGESPDEARTFAEGLLEDEAQRPFGLSILGELAMIQDDYDTAGDLLQQAVDLAPDNGYVALIHARQLRWNGDYMAAIDEYGRAGELGVLPIILLPERAHFLYEIGRYESVIPNIELLFSLMGRELDTDLVYQWAGSYILLGDSQGALNVLERYADKSVPEWEASEYYSNLAYIAWRANARQVVDRLTERAQEFEGDGLRLQYLQALMLTQDGLLDEALEQFEALRGVPPDSYGEPYLNSRYGHEINLDIARLHIARRDMPAALDAFSASIETIPWWTQPYLERARLYQTLGEIDNARADLRSAFELEEDPDLRARIRELLLELGDE